MFAGGAARLYVAWCKIRVYFFIDSAILGRQQLDNGNHMTSVIQDLQARGLIAQTTDAEALDAFRMSRLCKLVMIKNNL